MARIIFVTASLSHGGAERHSIGLMNRLRERGHETHAVYIKSETGQLDRILARDGTSAKCLGARRYLDRRALADFAAHIKLLRPSVIIAANPYALMYSRLALLRSGVRVPLVTTFHTTLLPGVKEWLQMLYYRPFFWTADCVVFVCAAQRTHWLQRLVGARRNEVIHNGVDLAYWSPLSAPERDAKRASLGLSRGDLVIGICAVFRPEKNHFQLIDAIAALRRRGIPARALLIGDGALRGEIVARARELGVAGEVLVTGFQNDVRAFVAASDVMVLCSTSVETFSLAALESMALGRPVVLSDVGGAAEMVSAGENGFLFPAGDTNALVERLVRLVDPQVRGRIGTQARERTAALFSETTMVDRYEQLLVGIARPRSCAEVIPLH